MHDSPRPADRQFAFAHRNGLLHYVPSSGFDGVNAPGPRSKVDFRRAADGSVVLTRADGKRPASRFAKLRGHAGRGLDTDTIMKLTRGEV